MKLARAIIAVLIATAFAYTLTASASAADKDCIDFAGNPQAAQDYFLAGGGSPDFNYNRLDGDGDGFACEATAQNTSSGGGGTDVPVDNSGDVPADTTDTTDTSGDVPADSGEVATDLPNTGSGPISGTDTTQIAVLALLSLVTLGAASQVNRRRNV